MIHLCASVLDDPAPLCDAREGTRFGLAHFRDWWHRGLCPTCRELAGGGATAEKAKKPAARPTEPAAARPEVVFVASGRQAGAATPAARRGEPGPAPGIGTPREILESRGVAY